VALKTHVNGALARATGYKLVRAGARPSVPPSPPRRRRDPARHLDAETREILRAVRPRTMTAREKVFALVCATRYAVDQRIPGTIVECGVWRGGSMQAAALALRGRGAQDRELHLFDTFEGMSEPTDADRTNDGRLAAELLATRERTANVWAVADLEDVRAGMAETGYPPERIHFHRGRVEETIPEQAPQQIAILRLDTDWYESTRHELEHLYDRLVPGGVLIIDDYGSWQGARKAVDEFMARTGAPLLLVPIATGRIAVKPAG
jgi:O-methyltransferase